MREEEIEIGRRMTLVSGRMRDEVTVLLENLDSRKGMSAEELREVIVRTKYRFLDVIAIKIHSQLFIYVLKCIS